MRKMSQSAIVINGSVCADGGSLADANTNMVTKMNELISSAKPMETFNSQDTKATVLTFPCDFDHMYASMKEGMTVSNENTECKHLKEFCLLHLDLIQQQSEIIAKQEKQLQSLRQENDTLKQRLQRSDRRVGLNKTKDPDGTGISSTSISGSPTSGLSEAVLTHGVGIEITRSPRETEPVELGDIQSLSPRSTLSSGERKRVVRHSPSHWETNQVQAMKEDCIASVSSAGDLREDTLSSNASQQSYTAHNDERITAPQRSRNKLSIPLESKENSSISNQPASSVIERLSKKVKSKPTIPVLTTDTPYYTPMGNLETSWDPEEVEEPEFEKQVNGNILEIPQWRLKTYTSVYSMEGTENLDDEVFLKRHQRLETDERRRKRWDVQRIREQRHVEKLRQREMAAAGSGSGPGSERGEDGLASLWPCIDDALYLEITDELPVSAFGHPIAKFAPSTFSLPWLQGQTVGQTVRKSRPSTNDRFANRRRTTSGVRRKRPQQALNRQSFRPRTSLSRGATVGTGPTSRSFFSGRRSEASERK